MRQGAVATAVAALMLMSAQAAQAAVVTNLAGRATYVATGGERNDLLVKRDGTAISHGIVRGRLPDALYALGAQHRDRLGRIVPDGAAPRRYP